MRPSHIPNAITLLRILLVLPIAWLLWLARYPEALLLMVVAGVSDIVDGALARHFDWRSDFGAMLDPLADKAMVVILFVVLTLQGSFPLWLAIIVVARDGVILAGAGVYRGLVGEFVVASTAISKINTAAQVVVLILALIELCDFGVVSDIAAALVDPFCFYLLAVLAIVSGLDYVITWSLKAWRNAPRTADR